MRRLKRFVFLSKDLEKLTDQHPRTCERGFKKMKKGKRFISLKHAAIYLGLDFDDMIDMLGLWA